MKFIAAFCFLAEWTGLFQLSEINIKNQQLTRSCHRKQYTKQYTFQYMHSLPQIF